MKRSKKIRHLVEYILFLLFIRVVKTLGLERSANLLSFILKKIKNLLKFTKIARCNIKNIYNLANLEQERLIDGMYDNFGRFMAEIAVLDSIDLSKSVTVKGLENIATLRAQAKPFILFAGHFANWEVLLGVIAKIHPDSAAVYRKINNPYIDKFIYAQRLSFGISLIPKGPEGGRVLIQELKKRKTLGVLIDQKMNEGIKVPFMGHDTMTSDGFAKIALTFDYPVLPLQIVRINNTSNFNVIIHKPLEVNFTDDKQENIKQIVLKANLVIEEWIDMYPEQWLWFHRRWSK
jgi:KDO2-lipid IV(A) lauroyltransferase